MFGVVVEVDYVGKEELKKVLKEFGNGVEVGGSYVVRWGKGVDV